MFLQKLSLNIWINSNKILIMNVDLLFEQAKQVCLRIFPMSLRARLSGVKMGGETR